MGHHCWSFGDHLFRNDTDPYDGTIEIRNAPPQLSVSKK